MVEQSKVTFGPGLFFMMAAGGSWAPVRALGFANMFAAMKNLEPACEVRRGKLGLIHAFAVGWVNEYDVWRDKNVLK